MNSAIRPTVTIVHELRGRLRLRLSHPIDDHRKLVRVIVEHTGIEQVRYTAISRSVLVTYDPEHVSSEEIVIRAAMSLSIEQGHTTVRVLAQPHTHELSNSAFYSGIALLAALGLRLVPRERTGGTTMDWVANLSTVGAALEHGWNEYRTRGNFDPEVLTVTYLLTAIMRGQALPAALFTWITTFGRHLVKMPTSGVEIRPVRLGSENDAPRYEVIIAPDCARTDKMAFLGMIPNMLLNALTGSSPGKRASMLDEIRRVSNMHDQVLEGVSDFRYGIPLRIR